MARIMRSELRKRGVESLKVVYSKEVPVKQRDSVCQGDGSLDTFVCQENRPPDTHRPVPTSISFVPPVAGLILAGEIIKDLVT